MTTSAAVAGRSPDAELLGRVAAVRGPRPLLDRDRERRLTERQREILDRLGAMFGEGFAHLTMAELAGRLNCSLRTLYALAPSRDELVLLVVDRNLRQIGRRAREAITADMAPLDALRAYLHAASLAVSGTTEAYARDMAAMPSAQRLGDDHAEYVMAIAETMLELARERGDIGDVDVAAVARVLAGLGRDFARPEVIAWLTTSPKDAADTVVDLILRGLRTTARGGAG